MAIDMRADETLNALIRQFVKKGDISPFDRDENTVYQGVLISFQIDAFAYPKDGNSSFSKTTDGLVLASARGGNYVSIFGAEGRHHDRLSVPPESWKLLARHDSCWTDGTYVLMRNMKDATTSECPLELKPDLRFTVRLEGSEPITIVGLKMPNGETIGQITAA